MSEYVLCSGWCCKLHGTGGFLPCKALWSLGLTFLKLITADQEITFSNLASFRSTCTHQLVKYAFVQHWKTKNYFYMLLHIILRIEILCAHKDFFFNCFVLCWNCVPLKLFTSYGWTSWVCLSVLMPFLWVWQQVPLVIVSRRRKGSVTLRLWEV